MLVPSFTRRHTSLDAMELTGNSEHLVENANPTLVLTDRGPSIRYMLFRSHSTTHSLVPPAAQFHRISRRLELTISCLIETSVDRNKARKEGHAAIQPASADQCGSL